jgi:hypothetical protein
LVEGISDTAIVWLCLFNNLLAPLLAELFVSPDCFLYIFSQAPALIFNYDVYSCRFESNQIGSTTICSVPLLFAQGYGTSVDVSIIPPFHYSCQCSFSLISSYSYVFIFRYVITGFIEPLIRLLLIHFAFVCNFQVAIYVFRLIPPLWQTVAVLQMSKSNSKHHEDSLGQLTFFESLLKNGIFRKRLVTIFTVDIAMLICFGALFPPLAVIIALSILKDVMSMRMALGRYGEIMETMQDDHLKEQMTKLRASIDGEILNAGTGIWDGVWYGMVMGTWIWAFILFDTMMATQGVDKGLGMLIGMIVSPFLLHYLLQMMKPCTKKVLKDVSNIIEERGIECNERPSQYLLMGDQQ